MTEHEMLHKICKKIGYKPKYKIDKDFDNNYIKPVVEECITVNVREIIFTQEFMDKWIDYRLKDNLHEDVRDELVILLNNLDNPTEYLYNLTK